MTYGASSKCLIELAKSTESRGIPNLPFGPAHNIAIGKETNTVSKVITTVTEYEEKALEAITKLQAPVLEYLKKAVDAVDGRISSIELPFDLPFELPEIEVLDKVRSELPTLQEIVDSQFKFSKKVLANQEKFAKNVVKAVKPLTPEPKKAATTAA